MKATRFPIEPLETRIAPAAVLAFTDVDGDQVKIFNSNTNAIWSITNLPNGQLALVDLTDASNQGVHITFAVTKVAGGDGIVHIGRINATGRDLGSVTIPGDLGDIDCGDGNTTTPALRSLSVRSMGLWEFATQGGAGDLVSTINGPLGALSVAMDLQQAHVFVNAATAADGKIGSVAIGGSLVGGSEPGSGRITASGDIGRVSIGRDVVGSENQLSGSIRGASNSGGISIGGSLVGGAGATSGALFFTGNIGPVKIGGDVIGVGFASGSVTSNSGAIASLTIGGSVRAGDFESAQIFASTRIGALKIGGNVIGGPSESAQIFTDGDITSVSIGGSLVGGRGGLSGTIRAAGDIGPVTIGGDVRGGGENSGKIVTSGKLTSLTIGGSLIGGEGPQDSLLLGGIPHPGQVYALGDMGPVRIAGDVIGGIGNASGSIKGGTGNSLTYQMGAVSVGGSILGGAGGGSAKIESAGSLGAVTIGGNLAGGTGDSSGTVSANGTTLASITIGGSLIGGGTGVNEFAGAIFSRTDMGPVKIGGDVLGGPGESTGFIDSFGKIASVSIGGSLVGGVGASSGSIFATKAIGSISIGHDLLGGSIPAGALSLFGSGAIISQERIGSIVIGGSIVSGVDDSGDIVDGSLILNATIRATRFIDSITVRGDIVGNVTPDGDSPVVISAGGRVGDVTGLGPSEVAIGRISVGGRVEWAKVLAGYDLNLNPVNADAQIGSVTTGADWIASSIVAGARNTGANAVSSADDNLNFGDANDAKIAEATDSAALARIGSIVIGGQVFGTPESVRPADSFGFIAEEIGALKVGARVFTLQPGAGNDGFTIARRSDSILDDARLHEVGALFGFTLPAGAAPLLVNASTVTYADADGDRVTVKFSKPVLTLANVNTIFTFSATLIGNLTPVLQQLQKIDVGSLQSHGLGITVTVAPGGKGDGLAHVGGIYSIGYDLGAVVVPGDLHQIFAGSGDAIRPGLASLDVRTLGRLGSDGNAPGGQQSVLVTGKLGTLTVRQDIAGTPVQVTGAIGPISIGGSMIGGDGNNSGRISATGAIGPVQIGHHVQGGAGQFSGALTGLSIASATIGGSVFGSSGIASARIDGGGSFPTIKLAHNLRGGTASSSAQINEAQSISIGGSVLGGRGTASGTINTEGPMRAVSIAHNLVGGADDAGSIVALDIGSASVGGSLVGSSARSGAIVTFRSSSTGPADGDIGPVKIGRDILGGSGVESGRIFADGTLGAVTVGGTVRGAGGADSGGIASELAMGAVKIGRNLLGGAGQESGVIFTPSTIASVTLGGSLIGGTAGRTGSIFAIPAIGAVKIGGDVAGGARDETGLITARDRIGAVSIGGSLLGGDVPGTSSSGAIYSSSGTLGAVTIGRDMIGGAAATSAWIEASEDFSSLTVGGSLMGGSAGYSGVALSVAGDVGPVKIGRNLIGGSVTGNASLSVAGYVESDEGIASVNIGGSIFAGWDTSTGTLQRSASIRAGDDLGAVVVKGSLHGNATSPIILSARGEATPTLTRDLAIKSVSIGGRVASALILGGYSTAVSAADTTTAFVNNDAQIGPVTVGRDWLASSLVAGILDAGNNGFGNAGDTPDGAGAISRIASIILGGVVAGSATAGDHFGFTAVTIGSFKSLNFTAPLNAAKNLIALSPITADVNIREA